MTKKRNNKTKRSARRAAMLPKTGLLEPPPAPAPKPLALLELVDLFWEITENDPRFNYRSDFRKKCDQLAALSGQLQVLEEELEFAATPLREMHAAWKAERPADAQHYDRHLKEAVARLKYKDYRGKPTGAKSWKQLATSGASDQEIRGNLQHLETAYSGAWRIDSTGLTRTNPSDEYGPRITVAKGAELVAAIRRVYGIGEPVKAAPAKKPAAKKRGDKKSVARRQPRTPAKLTPTAKKPTPKKPAAKRPQKSGAQKRRERAEREAAAAKTSPEPEPDGDSTFAELEAAGLIKPEKTAAAPDLNGDAEHYRDPKNRTVRKSITKDKHGLPRVAQ